MNVSYIPRYGDGNKAPGQKRQVPPLWDIIGVVENNQTLKDLSQDEGGEGAARNPAKKL